MWQKFIHVSKSNIHLQDSMHQAQEHHPWGMHVAPPKSWILRAAQDPGGFWRLKPSLNLVSDVIWLTTKFYQISICSSNFQIFMSMGPTLRDLKLWPQNVSEADTCTIWNYNMKSQTGQKENANERQTFEHTPKMWNFCTKKIDPRFDQFGPDHHRGILLYKPGLKKPSLQTILN